MSRKSRPDYGLDAPGVVRNLALAALASFGVAAAATLGWLPRDLVAQVGKSTVHFPLVTSPIFTGLGFGGAAVWMWWGSRFGKTAEREALLDRVTWNGAERVLDVGCGRGLLLVGAAKRLTSGSAVGIDLWRAVDLADNRAEVPLENAALEGVAPRVGVQTADMRQLPFADGSFDVVVSRAAVHNLYSVSDRAAAIREIARVLAPGGRVVLADVRHFSEYVRTFRESGCDARLVGSRIGALLCALFTMGQLRPNTLIATRQPSARTRSTSAGGAPTSRTTTSPT